MTQARWVSPEAVAQQYSVGVDDVQALIDAGELTALQFPSGPRINARSAKLLERALRNGYVPQISDLPVADMRVGSWSLPSGRSVEMFLGAAQGGVRRVRVLYDDVAPLSEEDHHALHDRVLPEAADKILHLTGRRGCGLIALPLPRGSAG